MSLTITKTIVSWHTRMPTRLFAGIYRFAQMHIVGTLMPFMESKTHQNFLLHKKTSSSFYESLSINPYWKNLFLLLLFSGYCSRICSFIIPVPFFTEQPRFIFLSSVKLKPHFHPVLTLSDTEHPLPYLYVPVLYICRPDD